MSAVLDVREPSARPLDSLQPLLVRQFGLLAAAPDGVARLRELILTLAVQGKLVPQSSTEAPASELLSRARLAAFAQDRQRRARASARGVPIGLDDLLPDLPPGWSWCKGSDLYSVIRGVTYEKTDASDSPKDNHLPILRANNIRATVNLDNLVYVPQHLVSDDQMLRRGDFVVCLASGSKSLVGKAAEFTGDVACSFGAFCGVIRLAVPVPFLSVFFASPLYRDEVSESSTGIGINNLKGSTLLELVMPLPPLAEQARIVARVDELMRLCDALEEKGRLEAEQHARLLSTLLSTLTDSATPEELAANWQRVAEHFDLLLDRPEAVDALEQSVLSLAVRGLLVSQDPADEPASALVALIAKDRLRLEQRGLLRKRESSAPPLEEDGPFSLPAGWKWLYFGDYVHEVCTGPFGSLIHKSDYVAGGVPLINPSHMVDGAIRHDPDIALSLERARELSTYRLREGDVLLARRGEVGRYALVTKREEGWLCGTGSFFARLAPECNRQYFGLMLEDPRFRSDLLGESVGSTMVNLNQRILLRAKLAIPPIAEQARIVARVTELRRLCATLRERLQAQQATQSRLAEALVEQALSA